MHTIDRREFLGALAGAAALKAAERKPNIVFILADDLGYGDVGCYGQMMVRTPNIDRIASEGTRFTQAYAGSTVCAPSRCALMTGLHTGHARIRGNARVPLLPSDVTVPKVLRRAGYRTALIGKWGLGNAGSTGVPNLQGFDEFFGYLDQQHAHTYYPDHLWDNQDEMIIARNLGVRQAYSHDLIADRALRFLERQKSDPFFLYLAFTLPHANNELGRDTGNGMEVPNDAPYSDRPWPQPDRNWAAMVGRLDDSVGHVMAQLKDMSVDDNTLVFFTSDNGPHREGNHNPDLFRSSGPFRGIKRDLYEGGIRVPMIARWPGRVPAGRTSDAVWAFWDFLPTAAEVAGVRSPDGIDGISVLPALLGKPQKEHEYLYWEFHEGGFHQGIRIGDWKGVRHGLRQPVEVYDLKADPGERNNLASTRPDIASKLASALDKARTDSKDFPVREKAASAGG